MRVQVLLPAGASPHTYEPRPTQIREAQGARLLVRVGADLDGWAERMVSVTDAAKVTAADGVALLDDPHEEGHGDPHIWLDPTLLRDHFLPALVAALTRLDAAHAGRFASAAAVYRGQLDALDAEIAGAVSHWRRREYVALHQSWQYFGRRYGLRQIGVVEESPGKEPSARAVARLVDAARASGCRVVLVEPQLSRRVAETIAGEFGGAVVEVDPLGGPGLRGRDSYIGLMRFNLQAFNGVFE